jgi:hypothetical protein
VLVVAALVYRAMRRDRRDREAGLDWWRDAVQRHDRLDDDDGGQR